MTNSQMQMNEESVIEVYAAEAPVEVAGETGTAPKLRVVSNETHTAEYVYVDKPVYEVVKRVFDIVFASIALVVLFPLMLVVAIAIVIDDPKAGPIYTQMRTGRHGKEFKFYKFRSMFANADELQASLMHMNEMDGPVFKITDDPRITKVGKFIRKTSIDELPQLVNIIRGDMSIVGPRPPLPKEVAQYTEYQMHRLDVKGGLTCYWQISGRNSLGFEDWVKMDLQYITERSVWTDMKIIARTFGAVLGMTGK